MYAVVATDECKCSKVVASLSNDQCSLAVLMMHSTAHCQQQLGLESVHICLITQVHDTLQHVHSCTGLASTTCFMITQVVTQS
jgi:hypothetical protein